MKNSWEIQLSGSGGQGMVLAGLILAEGAVLAGKNVVQTQTYGPEARGGATKAEVIVSEGEIDYPKVSKPDLLLAMSQAAFDKYASLIEPGDNTMVLIDSTIVTDLSKGLGNIIALPMTKIAVDDVGKAVVANMVALGALVTLTKVIPQKCLEEAALARIPKSSKDLNLKALRLGCEVAQKICGECGIAVS
ncbi:MAG: 2-oxoacid:ferredoxin oxidoreductase subunit gamma [Clostridia bacterium]|jgi:2-oxoglutarate ferredoxin oxidoreductase subunit gamma|nr:2-oxoacid:ferredoxin oxidoreductase subunit gamma [Clostridia bacterium]